MKRTLKSIEPVQLGKISGALYGLMSLIVVPFFILFAAIGSLAPKGPHGPGAIVVVGICLAMAIVMPIMYAAMGFIIGVIGAVLYNLIAKWVGGIRIEVE